MKQALINHLKANAELIEALSRHLLLEEAAPAAPVPPAPAAPVPPAPAAPVPPAPAAPVPPAPAAPVPP
ncbi:hypothetical protein, partial [Thiolapillus sp.]|uniref:hypothetical protein n=1 Tax=Thiolapillus sp. TaxID=2017437 RepID=UPI003AF5CF01